MKKISIFALAAAMIGLSACDEYTLPNPPAQSNPAEPVFQASGLTVNTQATAVNLPALRDANEMPVLADYTLVDFPANNTLKLVLQMSETEDFAEYGEVPTVLDETNTVSVSVYDFQNVYSTTITRGLETKTINIRYAAYSVNGNEVVRIGGPETFYAPSALEVTPVLLTHEIEEAYYLVGDFCDWKVNQGKLMTKVNPGNQYDEPDFTVKIDVTEEQAAAGFRWKIVPASALSTNSFENAYGCEPTSESGDAGHLIAAPETEANAGVISEPGSYQITVDMFALTYKVGLAYEFLYVNATGYYTDAERILRLATDNYITYSGVARVNKTFSLACQTNLSSGVFYGMDGDAEVADGVVKANMALVTDISKLVKFNTGGNQLYFVKAALNTLTIEISPIDVISIVGAFNGWNVEDEEAVMTPSNRNCTWTIQNVNLPEGEFKFCVNHAWTLSFGGQMDKIVENGGNLSVDQAGVYDVVLDFTKYPNTVTLTKK